jgi:2-keto-4-pentenoate hydratase/2-oxohepta-3-ene-1,7-dioic acid hydratase in catechol pathway
VKQQARTSQMIYPWRRLFRSPANRSRCLPGDLIMTGTPSGVGPIKEGDELEARIGDWPPLRNRVGMRRAEKNNASLAQIPGPKLHPKEG